MPVEVLPLIVDGEPALLRLMIADQVVDRPNVHRITWEDFFVKFDALGLTFVYDDGATGHNEILQVEANSPYRNPKDQVGDLRN